MFTGAGNRGKDVSEKGIKNGRLIAKEASRILRVRNHGRRIGSL